MPAFLPIPAIDLMNGEVVRLARGEADARTVYSDDPAEIARGFVRAGIGRIHVVDLDGAFGGTPANVSAIEAIRRAVDVEIEVGGGLRTADDVEDLLALGVDYAILGTSAVRERELLAALVAKYGKKIIVGIDAKDGKVAVEGWVKTSDLTQEDFARDLAELGVSTIIATDIATDGMMTGPNLESLAAMADAASMQVIASGGLRSVEDLRAVRALGRSNIIGAITGRAVYEGSLDLSEAVGACAE